MNPFKSIKNLFKANNAGNESTQQSFSKDFLQSLNKDLGAFVYVDDGFEHQLNGRVEKLTWHEIEKIYAYKTAAFGAEETCLDIEYRGAKITVAESTPGWTRFFQKIRQVYPSIPENFDWESMGAAYAATPMVIYEKGKPG